MRCNRCGYAVPEWLWLGDDHPLIIEEQKPRIYRDDNIINNTIKITAETLVSIRMCKDVNVPNNSDFIDIGPECFANKEETVISWKGENFYRACDKLVTGTLEGAASHCVKRVRHKNDCEDYDGNTRGLSTVLNDPVRTVPLTVNMQAHRVVGWTSIKNVISDEEIKDAEFVCAFASDGKLMEISLVLKPVVKIQNHPESDSSSGCSGPDYPA